MLASKYHFELPIIVNRQHRQLYIARDTVDDQWYYGLIAYGGKLPELARYGPFPSNYTAYIAAIAQYGLDDNWKMFKRLGKV